MATINLVFDRTRAQIGSVQLDVSISEQHTSTNEVTDHPVEVGVNIVDHVRPKPDVLKIEGMVSNTPLPSSDAPAYPVTVNGITFLSKSQFQAARAGTAYSDLLSLQSSASLITVVTGLRTYDNMVIESLDVPRDAKVGQALRFSCTLKQIKTAVLQTAKIVPTAKVDKGKKATTTPTKEQSSSVLNSLDEASGNKGSNFLIDLLGKGAAL
jgi:hypothetical protein